MIKDKMRGRERERGRERNLLMSLWNKENEKV